MKSGMLAAETMFEACSRDDFSARSAARLRAALPRLVGASRAVDGAKFPPGLRARAVRRHVLHRHRDRDRRLGAVPGPARGSRATSACGSSTSAAEAAGAPEKFDGRLTFDKLTDVYHSGTTHDEDQPVAPGGRRHRDLRDALPRGVRQPVPALLPGRGLRDGARRRARRRQAADQRRQLRALQDLRHRRPYQIITWVPPEGGGGPRYVKL